MSLATDRILLESKINQLKKARELKIIEGEMFVTQTRDELSPYLEFTEINIEKAKIALGNIVAIREKIDEISKDIKALERKLN